MTMTDVTVRGAGIFGLTVAWTCLQRGARVTLVDPAGPASGASGGVVGALSPHAPDAWNPLKDFQLRSLLATGGFWQEVDAVSGRPSGYGRTGRLQSLPDERAVARARARVEGARRHWGDAAAWEVVPADGDWPPSATGLAVHDTLSARLHPARACASLATALDARGVPVVPEAPDAGAVVWAAGPAGLEALSAAFGCAAGRGVKGQAIVLEFDAARRPQLYLDGLHVVAHADGTVGIGSTTEAEFERGDATDAQADTLHSAAVAACPVLAGAPVVRRWAGVRPRARSRAPMLGPWPGRQGHFVANGGFKIGFGVAVEVGRVIADLVLDGRDAIPAPLRVEASLG